jgi:hypothetical protein
MPAIRASRANGSYRPNLVIATPSGNPRSGHSAPSHTGGFPTHVRRCVELSSATKAAVRWSPMISAIRRSADSTRTPRDNILQKRH